MLKLQLSELYTKAPTNGYKIERGEPPAGAVPINGSRRAGTLLLLFIPVL
jgi:hypothetical protein